MPLYDYYFILQLGVSVLAAEGTVHHLLIDACVSHRIVVLSGLSHHHLLNMCAVTGGKIVHSLHTASSVSCVG